MGQERKRSKPSNPALDFGPRGQIEHRIQVDRRLAAVALAHQARPDGIVELGVIVGMFTHGLILVLVLSSPAILYT